MKNLRSWMVLSLAPLTGCMFGGAPDGIWLIEVPYQEGSENCETEIDHNFSDADVPEDVETEDGPWTYEDDGSRSPTLFFVQLVDSAKGEVLLIIGDEIYPGTKQGSVWKFTWDAFDNSTEIQEHEEGYEYVVETDVHSVTTWDLNLKGKTLSGTASGTSSGTVTYTESDTWDAFEVGRSSGYIPADDYLESDMGFVYNDPDVEDCDDSDCFVEFAQDCSGSGGTFTGRMVDYFGDWDDIEGASQGPDND